MFGRCGEILIGEHFHLHIRIADRDFVSDAVYQAQHKVGISMLSTIFAFTEKRICVVRP